MNSDPVYHNINFTNSSSEQISEYDQIRIENKNSVFKSTLVLLKITLGVAVMVLPYLYSKNGYILGTLILLAASLNMYICSVFIIDITDHIENKQKVLMIQNFEDVSLYLTNNEFINRALFWFIKVF